MTLFYHMDLVGNENLKFPLNLLHIVRINNNKKNKTFYLILYSPHCNNNNYDLKTTNTTKKLKRTEIKSEIYKNICNHHNIAHCHFNCNYWVRHLTLFFQLVLISWIVILSLCLIRQIISFILPPNEYNCVYAWPMLGSGPAIDLQTMPILAKKKIIFSDEAYFDLGG